VIQQLKARVGQALQAGGQVSVVQDLAVARD
jgi:hypothetical protein